MNSNDFSTRRMLLRRAGVGLLAAYVAPALTGYDIARASGSGGSGGGSRGGSRPAPPQKRQPQQRRRARPARPELVLLSDREIGAALREAGYEVLQTRPLRQGVITRLRLAAGQGVPQARADLARRFPSALVDENTLYRPEAFECTDRQCDAHAAIGWHLGSADGKAAKIGMIDTGVNTAHEALAGQNLKVIQADLGTRAMAGRQHGTSVATLLVGRADSRTPGLVPQARLVAIEAFHRTGKGEAADAYALSDALDQLLAEGVAVINLSFAGAENAVFHAMIRRATEAGVAVVAAAGNGGAGGKPAYPAAWPEVVAVTAVDRRDQAYRHANRGDYIDFAAPGVNLWTAASISGGRLKSGTSYAAPFVTAALAVRIADNPALPIADHLAALRSCTRDLGEKGADPIFGDGLISVTDQCVGGIPVPEAEKILPVAE